MLITNQQLEQLKANLQTEPWKSYFEQLTEQCEAALIKPFPKPRVEMHNWTLGRARSLLRLTVSLATLYRLTGDARYAKRAATFLLDSIDWELWFYKTGVNDQGPFDLGTGETALSFAVCLPWIRDQLSDEAFNACLDVLNRRVLTPYLESTVPGQVSVWWYDCLHNWNVVCSGGMLAVAAYLESLGYETERARLAQQRALAGMDLYFEHMHADGSCDEGTGYWGYATKYFTLCLLYWENVHGKKHPFFDEPKCRAWLRFPLEMSPYGQSLSFGDVGVFHVSGAHIGLAARVGDNEVLAELMQRGAEPSDTVWTLLLYAKPTAPPPPHSNRRVVWYPDNGWGVLTHNDCALSFRSGSTKVNHAQKDLNSIQLSKAGVLLLANIGNGSYSVGWFGEARHLYFEENTTSKNSQLLNGIGQIRYAEAIASFENDVITSDSAPAFPDFVSKMIRAVALSADGFVLRDTFAVKQESWSEIRFLTYGTFTGIDENTWRVERNGQSAVLRVTCEHPMESRVSEAPLSTNFREQVFMLRFRTQRPVYATHWETHITPK